MTSVGRPLRGLRWSGCTEAEIAAITGPSLRDVAVILDVHYLHHDPPLAETAVRKLENRNKISQLTAQPSLPVLVVGGKNSNDLSWLGD
jgi:hypothetical protein